MRCETESRRVMNESGKWRSGREPLLVVVKVVCGRGGKSEASLADDEGVAAQDRRDVVMPPPEAAPFEVIQSQLAFEVLVDSRSRNF